MLFYKIHSMIKYSIGIDISKSDFHASFSTIDEKQYVKVIRSGTFKNSKIGFGALEKCIKTTCCTAGVPVCFTMEATGVYYENCALFLFGKGYSVSVVLPNKSKKYIAALGIKTKNDKVDAKALSRMGAEQALETWVPMGEFFYHLRSLTRHNQSLKEMRTAFNNQVEAAENCMYVDKVSIRSLGKLIKTLDIQIEENTEAIITHVNSNKPIAKKIENITAIKGVGILTVAVILGETNGFELFKNIAQLVSYSGYDVVENQSGSHTGKTKISKKGNSRIRRALHMPSLCLVTHDVKVFKNLYERTVDKHGIKMKSYVAVQKKLLGIIYTLWKKNEKFDENYVADKTTKEEEVVHSSRNSFA
jgi:transposase